jgi:DNA primase
VAGIPEEIVERVKAEASIVDVISDYVRLRRAGKNWIGLCPFHDDQKPSFNVEPVKGIYKCFACGKGGNVFTFLMEKNGWSFPETVRNLATGLGIEIPEDAGDRREFSERERLLAAVRDAAAFYYKTLRSEAGLVAQTYFRQRGFSDEVMKEFGLGYAPDEWDALIKRLTTQGYTTDELDKAGLIIRRESGSGYYDRFRGRSVFPIFGATGRVLGFGARRMTEDPNQPKYINSPESPVYQKGKVLYGLFQAKDTIRRTGRALFVEGYADVISLHDAGVKSAIATSGTAMSRDHAELIARYCSRIVLIFDSDRAGEAATERGIDVLLRQGLDVSVLRLPDGEDPDTFVRRYGGKELEKRIDESISFLEFRARALKNAGDFDSPDRSAEAVRSIVSTIALIPDALKRELYLQKIAADFHVSDSLLLREMERALGRKDAVRRRDIRVTPPPPIRRDEPSTTPSPGLSQGATPGTPPGIGAPSDATPNGSPNGAPTAASADAVMRGDDPSGGVPLPRDEHAPADGAYDLGLVDAPRGGPPALRRPVMRSEMPSAEVALLAVLVQGDPQLLEHVFARIDPDDFGHPLTRELIALILGHYVNQRSFALDDLVMEELSTELRDLVTLLAVERESISLSWTKFDPNLAEPNPWKIARDCLIRIEQEKIDRRSRALQDRLQDPELDDEERMAALVEFKALRERKEELGVLLAG